jgi:hypothetical protein
MPSPKGWLRKGMVEKATVAAPGKVPGEVVVRKHALKIPLRVRHTTGHGAEETVDPWKLVRRNRPS